MIKKSNGKKKKGFTLIELIIVLAVMAIIALIAIPNFTAVRDNSKLKADKQSCETIKRTVLMLVSDETITGNGNIELTPPNTNLPATDGDIKGSNSISAKDIVEEALKEVKAPQSKKSTGTKADIVDSSANPAKYTIIIKDGSVEVVTGAPKATT